MSTSNQTKIPPQPEHDNFFRYTSGRWLWDEERQIQDRYSEDIEVKRVKGKMWRTRVQEPLKSILSPYLTVREVDATATGRAVRRLSAT
ncbi:hypothetical protein BJX70DRAFT_374078 [Aspergillus crustosus]